MTGQELAVFADLIARYKREASDSTRGAQLRRDARASVAALTLLRDHLRDLRKPLAHKAIKTSGPLRVIQGGKK